MTTSAPARTKRPRILLAEDDTPMRTVLAQALRTDGYIVTECSDGVELLTHLASLLLSQKTLPEEQRDTDLIISDIRMPGVTGMSILEGVRDQEAFPPMILITAFGDERIHEEVRRLGAVALLDKPFDVDDLLQKVHEVAPPGQLGDD
jgi:CheY-like chemotaxis protein